jgi:hypothetical protein
MNPGMQERYEGRFMEGGDFPEGTVRHLTIQSVIPPGTEKDARGKPIREAILMFAEEPKGLILGKTNYRVLKILFGDSEDWVGKEIRVMRRYLREAFGIKNELCVRIVPPKGTPMPGRVMKWMGNAIPYELPKE